MIPSLKDEFQAPASAISFLVRKWPLLPKVPILCIKTPSSAIQVLIFQLLVLRPRPSAHVVGEEDILVEDIDGELDLVEVAWSLRRRSFCNKC